MVSAPVQRHLAGALLMVTLVASHACLVNPQKDYPVGASSVGAGDSSVGGRSSRPSAQGDGGALAEGGDAFAADAAGNRGAAGSTDGGAAGSAGTNACGAAVPCGLGEICEGQQCRCAACPRGGLRELPNNFCRAPIGATAAGAFGATDTPEHAIDGDEMTAWSSGDYVGSLVISFTSPQPASAVVLVPQSSPGGIVDYTITVTTDRGAVETETSTLKVSSQAWFAVPLRTPAMLTELKIDAHSANTWISLWEVLVVPCGSLAP